MPATADEQGGLRAMKHVCIVSGDHLWINPRVVKEADALSAAGFQVTVVGPAVTAFDQARDLTILAGRPWKRISAPDLLKPSPFGIKRFVTRLARRAQITGVRWLGLPLAGSLGYGIGGTVRAAAALNADLYACHVEAGLVMFQRLSRQGRACVFDFEDWHARDLLPGAQRSRPVGLISALERLAINNAVFTTTTSQALADALTTAYGGPRPVVVYNAFEARTGGKPPGQAFKDRRSRDTPSLHWYSQVVGEGRGLELLFDAVNLLETEFELHIRGKGSNSYKESLLQRLAPKARASVFFHPTTEPAELPARIAEHDIGLALEARSPPSRDLTITNKVFQYLQGGCAVIATRTAGQEEAARLFPGAISLVEPDAKSVAEAIRTLVDDRNALTAARRASRQAGGGPASWEQACRPMVARFRQALEASSGGAR